MALSDVITVTITATSVGVTQAGFGVPLILGTPSWASDRIRFYTDITGVLADFAVTRPEYLAAQAIFSQSPRPPKIAIGRLANKPTQRWTITPAVANSTKYTMVVDGQTVTYTSDGSATADEICDGLTTLINALASPAATCTASNVSSTVRLTSNAAGNWDAVAVADPALLDLVQDHADPGYAADLAAIALADNTWYGIVNPWNSAAVVTVIATYAEANTKLFLYATQDGQCATHALSGATDIMAAQKTAAHKRSAGIYHPDNGAWADAAWAGRCLPLDPGSETWAFKTLAGVAATVLTSTQRGNIVAKHGNTYETVAGINITSNTGSVQDGEFIDVIRFVDWLTARMGERIFALLAAVSKVPYLDRGIASIADKVSATLSEGVDVGGLGSYTVSVPKVKDAQSSDKTARVLKNLSFNGVLAGAVHTVNLTGTVSV